MKPWVRALAYLCPLLLSIEAVKHAAAADVRQTEAAKVAISVPVSAELSKAMGDLGWGISREELQKKLEGKVEDRYRLRLAKAHDTSEKERLRRAADDEVERIKNSYVEFNGTSTPWDTSFLRGEFTHGSNESMLASRDETSQTFYFFIAGKLWKMYTVLDVLVLPEGNFAAFASSLERRFGPANKAADETSPGAERHWIEWQDDKTTLRTTDQTNFFGFYFVILEDRRAVSELAGSRAHAREVDWRPRADGGTTARR